MPNVLSIQSHVVSGYVGNRAATFPMQYMGLDVDVINTVQLSNHTGYEKFIGKVFDSGHILELFEGLEYNKIDEYSYLLTGYMGNASNVDAVESIAKKLKKKNDKLFFLLDTVLGDYGKLYVPKELIALYREKLVLLADLVTPNQFEAELITERKITKLSDAIEACDYFHNLGVPNVIITSSLLEDVSVEGMDNVPLLHMIGSHMDPVSKTKKAFRISFPNLPGYFTGAGDLFCSLILSRLATDTNSEESGSDKLKKCCELAFASQNNIIEETMKYQKTTNIPAPLGLDQSGMSSELVKSFELKLIANRKYISDPIVKYQAVDI
ncbi:hypothetical protein BB559_000169 [Furculomyces boomerangus]|uniref:pyridoxal kinase n=2 Tax=Harpellales TaxID=61421 RepID=A0A2T9Z5Z6_9FUNG|nr:hypothetical protein BB559_000169 [Furculomyces boomerangus]PVZ99611.1 hypothetical protein BB558_004361 [Smittium angustum]